MNDIYRKYCTLCHSFAELHCQRCRDPYCSSRCQKIDWLHHKTTCFPLPFLLPVRRPESKLRLFGNLFNRNTNNGKTPIIAAQSKQNDSTTNNMKVPLAVKAEKIEDNSQETISNPEPWMKPFPIEEKEFVPVIVQYVAEANTWVMVAKNEVARNHLVREINKGVATAPTPNQKEIKKNSLFRVRFEGVYHRGAIVEPVTLADTVVARLIDYGNEVIVPITELKSSIPVMVNLNAFSFSVKFQKPRKVEICDKINIKIKSMKGDEMTVIVKGEDPILTMNDIEVVPIPAGKKLYCLNFSKIMDEYISACVFDTKAIAKTDLIGSNITDYCTESKINYTPQVDELCLAKFDDGQWYRATVLKVAGEKYEIIFIDYGNTTTASSADIRKMPQKFMHYCLMNRCYIKDFPKKTEKKEIRELAVFFNDNQIFEVVSLETENGKYVIKPKL